jgi:hypothetical protein
MRYAVAALWTIPALFLLGIAGMFGALAPLGRGAFWLFVLDATAMLGFAGMALIEASVAEPGQERRRVIALSLPSLVFGLGLALILYAVSHMNPDW